MSYTFPGSTPEAIQNRGFFPAAVPAVPLKPFKIEEHSLYVHLRIPTECFYRIGNFFEISYAIKKEDHHSDLLFMREKGLEPSRS